MVKSRSLKLAVIVAVVVMLADGGVWAQRSARPGAAGLMESIPAESLFCVRINRVDGSLDAVNEYLKGIAPDSFDAKTVVFSKLGGLLGDERLRGVNRRGNSTLFAVNVPGETAGQNPMANIFIGALLPVRNYDKFISRNPNCGEPDNEGISTITMDGRAKGLATRFRRFALICPPNAREKLPRVKKMLGQRKRSLANSLDDNEIKLASSSSIWLYLNVKQGAPLIKPMLFGKLKQIKAELQKATESGGAPMMIDPSGIFDFYRGIFKLLLDGTDRVAVALWPNAETCKVTFCLKPIPDTEMAAMVGQELGGDLDHVLGYLEDDAMMNIACKVDRKSLNAAYMGFLDLFGKMAPDGISDSDLQEVKALTTKMINALGDSLAITGGISRESAVPFRAKYVFEVRDEEAFKQALDQSFQMMDGGALDKLYKGFGMEMDVEIERNAETYKGISIDKAIVKFNPRFHGGDVIPAEAGMGEDELMQGMAIGKMFGDGLEYRLAFVEGHCIYTIGADADKTIRELIDQVRTGGPKEIAPEMKAALGAVDNSSEADVVGTFNYVRVLDIGLGMMIPEGHTDTAKPTIPTKSNIAFAGRTEDGKMTLQIVLPKRHLQEIKSAFETLIPQIEKQAK